MGIVKRQSVQSSVITYIGVAIGYVNLILLFPKFLTPEQLGLTRLLLSVATIFSQFSLLGTSVSILRFFPYLEDRKSRHHGFFSFTILVSLTGFIIFTLLFIILRGPITDIFQEKSSLFVQYYSYLFPLSFFLLFFELLFMYMRALFKTVVPTLIKEVVLRLIQTAALVLLTVGLVDFEGFLLLFIGSYLLHLLVIMGYAAYLRQLFIFSLIDFKGRVSVREVMRYSLLLFVAAIASYYTLNIDQIMLGALAGLASNAVYSIAFFIGTIIQIPGRAINSVAIPIVAEAWKQNDQKKLQQLYIQTSLNELIIGGFIFLLVWINTDLLLSLLPPIYQEAKWVIFIVGLGKLFDLATGINGEILVISKHSKATLFTNVFVIMVST
nr:oligosaccharide flippase family protein [Chitinophagales bacterium]